MIYTLEWYDQDLTKWRIQSHCTSREDVMVELRILRDDGMDVVAVTWRLGIYDLMASESIPDRLLRS